MSNDRINEVPTAPPVSSREMLPAAEIEALYETERRRLHGAVRRRVGDPEEAADIVQDAFARLLQARPSSVLQAPIAYLHRIVRNLLLDRSKRAEHRLLRYVEFPFGRDDPSSPAEQEWHLEAADLMTRYHAALQDLTPRTREVFLLHRVDELPYRDIASRLGITVATVEYHMARALTHLDRALEP